VGKTITERRPTERVNLTKKAIEQLTAEEKRVTVYDTRVPGLGVLVQPGGKHKSFFWFRKVRGVGEWKTLGDFPALSVENARATAQEHNSKLARWKADDYDGPNLFERKPNLTLGDVFEHYIEHHLKKHSTNPDKAVKGTRWQFERYLTSWKNRRIGSLQKRDVENLHTAASKEYGMVTANRLVTFLRTLFYHAERKMNWAGKNPAREPGRNKILVAESSRQRFIQEEELPKFFATLSQEPNHDLQDFIVIALFTGVRSGDILAMKWDQLSHDKWYVPNRKKPKQPYVAELMPEVLERLAERRKRRDKSLWVFPSRGKTGHVVSLKRGWQQFLKRTGLKDLRIHDLRRTLASHAAMQGTSLAIIGKSLGHRDSRSTEIYARLQTETVRQAVEQATRAMIVASQKKLPGD
jgi:integrase